ncbi:hypothetical protein [Jiella pacifica]|uniref:Uncharacterized protein n=1 Tax=Jiella pacifica TaxID=2696469 RepID=A0A6N9T3P2_9HYPH|nr:hypothetical protein [Jiella pacifica]NDW05871.1 hypothetical protein [Jiella pacifica]
MADDQAEGMSLEDRKDLVRQSERTIDNLKRILAFVFSLSFGLAASRIFERLGPTLTDPTQPFPTIGVLLVHLEMTSVFAVTAALFFHQGAKFLDIRYAKEPISTPTPAGFAFDFGVQMLTMVPFYAMAFSFGKDVIASSGYYWLFMSYVTLIVLGLVLLIISSIPRVRHTIPQEELKRELTTRIYWFVMNSFFLMLLAITFFASSSPNDSCPVGLQGGPSLFLYAFGAIVLVRDWMDYSRTWPYIYPTPANQIDKLKKWPMNNIERGNAFKWISFGALFLIASATFIILGRIYDYHHWTIIC